MVKWLVWVFFICWMSWLSVLFWVIFWCILIWKWLIRLFVCFDYYFFKGWLMIKLLLINVCRILFGVRWIDRFILVVEMVCCMDVWVYVVFVVVNLFSLDIVVFLMVCINFWICVWVFWRSWWSCFCWVVVCVMFVGFSFVILWMILFLIFWSSVRICWCLCFLNCNLLIRCCFRFLVYFLVVLCVGVLLGGDIFEIVFVFSC